MSTTQVPGEAQIIIKARVFRAKKVKPRFVPEPLWRYAVRRQWPGTGTWGTERVLAEQNITN